MTPTTNGSVPALQLRDAALAYGTRTLWSGLNLHLHAGEFIAVLGPNGSGKTSLLRVILGLAELTAGSATVQGAPVRRGNPRVGYIPQHRGFTADLSMRARDVVRLGLDGHRWGLPVRDGHRATTVAGLLTEVGADAYGDAPVGLLSGGEQQRLRVGQSLANDPVVLLCDEPLLTLDLHHQQAVVELLAARRRRGTAVLFVTHEINPVIAHVDRVLYLVDGRFQLGTVEEVMTGQTLTRLYGSPVEVIRSRGRLVVLGGDDRAASDTLDSHLAHDAHDIDHAHHEHAEHRHDPHGLVDAQGHDGSGHHRLETSLRSRRRPWRR